MSAASRLVARLLHNLWVGLSLLVFLSGCALVNPQSSVRLASDAQLTTRAIANSLDGTRKQLETFVEGQAIHAHLTGRSALSPSVLCSIKAVQRSLRLRVILLRKLASLYDSFITIAQEDTSTVNDLGVFDEVMADIDRYELLPEATPGPTCPDPNPDWQLGRAPPPPPDKPSVLLGFSKSKSLRRSSELIRQALVRVVALWDREREIYLSIQRQAFQSQKTLSRALLTKFGTLSPKSVFSPQLAGLGVDWDNFAYRAQLEKWPAEKQAAMQEAVLSVLDHRADQRVAEEEMHYIQHSELLRLLYRQHQVLERGQPLDLRQINLFLAPILRSVSPQVAGCPVASP
jgi:hypothetical protein